MAIPQSVVDPMRAFTAKFMIDDLVIGLNEAVVGFNFADNTLVLGTTSAPRAHPFITIVAAEVLRNKTPITQTNRGSQLLGAAVGGAALGGVGALIGGLTGSTRSRERMSDLAIKITVDDPTSPVSVFPILTSRFGKGVDPNSKPGRSAIQRADHLYGQLLLAMRRASNAGGERTKTAAVEQLAKLWDLHQAGAITELEYQEFKARLTPHQPAAGGPTRTDADWDESATVVVENWNGVRFSQFLPDLIATHSSRQILDWAKAAKRLPFIMKAVTPFEADRLRALFKAGGATVNG